MRRRRRYPLGLLPLSMAAQRDFLCWCSIVAPLVDRQPPLGSKIIWGFLPNFWPCINGPLIIKHRIRGKWRFQMR